jgi:hypothetical protein
MSTVQQQQQQQERRLGLRMLHLYGSRTFNPYCNRETGLNDRFLKLLTQAMPMLTTVRLYLVFRRPRSDLADTAFRHFAMHDGLEQLWLAGHDFENHAPVSRAAIEGVGAMTLHSADGDSDELSSFHIALVYEDCSESILAKTAEDMILLPISAHVASRANFTYAYAVRMK